MRRRGHTSQQCLTTAYSYAWHRHNAHMWMGTHNNHAPTPQKPMTLLVPVITLTTMRDTELHNIIVQDGGETIGFYDCPAVYAQSTAPCAIRAGPIYAKHVACFAQLVTGLNAYLETAEVGIAEADATNMGRLK